MDQLEKVIKLNEFQRKYKRSNKYMICFSYEDIGELIKIAEENIKLRKIPNYLISRERITISERLFNGLVRSLAWKIEYQSRVEEALKYLVGLDSLDSEQFYYLEEILKGGK